MTQDKFKENMEKPIYSSLEELFKRAELNQDERDVYYRYQKYCEYWLLRSKLDYSKNPISSNPNFIKLLARALINLESKMVTGKKMHYIKTMFSENKHAVCSFKITDEYMRSMKKTEKIENTYFELDIMSFFMSNGFNIKLSEPSNPGIKIPEFKALKNGIKINIEAKRLNYDIILNNIHGDHMSNGIDYQITDEERQDGYFRIMLQLKSRLENAIEKIVDIPQNEFYLIFIQATDLGYMGRPTIDYLNDLHFSWRKISSQFLGLVIPQHDKTYFITHKKANSNVIKILDESDINRYHSYIPEIIGERK